MSYKCPVIWKSNERYPCAFLSNGMCTQNKSPNYGPCIPKYIDRFRYAMEDITVHCSRCDSEISTKRHVVEKLPLNEMVRCEFLCPACSDYDRSLALHISGEL